KEVDTETFSLFQRNINPRTYGKLTQRTVMTGVRFFDFQCAAPKSVSIMSLWDERLEAAHKTAVAEAMAELEKLAAVRVRKGDNVRTNNLDITGKIVYASFTHDASRALDPQLHTHNVVVNVTKDVEGNYKALESLEMCRAIRYAGKVYHNRLAQECRTPGYKLTEHRDEKGNIVWKNIAGVPEEVMELFSKRRHQIEEQEAKFIEEHGRKPTLTENNYLSISTRNVKMKTSTKEKVREYQLAQLSADQQSVLERVYRTAYRDEWIIFHSRLVAEESLRQALALVYERESVVKLDKVLAEALNQNLGMVNLETLKKTAARMPELRNLGGLEVNPWVSPEAVIEREIYAVEAVEEQKDVFEPIAPDFEAFPGEATRAKQAELIHGILNSKDRFNLFRGVAGAGKTSTLQELCRGLRSGGLESIYLIAPTNSAADVLRQEGFEQSQTVARFLLSPKKPPAGSYVIIDEAGLNSLREGAELIKTARANNYRVLFVGDAHQHTAVESGDFFRLLEDHSKIERFALSDIYRQQNEEYRRGISECALGKFEAAFERFDRNGFIREGKVNYLEKAAETYMEYTENGEFIERSLLVAPTHDEGDKLTAAVRAKLKAAGAVAMSGRTTEIFRSWSKPKAWLKDAANYVPGTVVAFIRNMKGVGNAGETAMVERTENGMLYLDNGKCLYAKTAADFIEAGEMREVELCKGDLIQFNVNLRDRKIYNGNIAQITEVPGKVMLLYPDGKPRELIDLPPAYATYKYGWVTTSHKAQGRTAETVVVAAQALDRKAFYVALSRGRKRAALHCPEKEFLKKQLSFRSGERLNVHDLAGDGRIAPENLLHLSEDARLRKAKTLPGTAYKSVAERARKLMEKIKCLAGNLLSVKRKISARRARNRKYGFGIVTPETKLEIEHQNALEAIEEQRRQEERLARFRAASAPRPNPYQDALKKIEEMEKRSSTPVPVADTPEEDIVYPVPNPRPRESTIQGKSSDSSTLFTEKRHRGLESLERMKAQDKPRLSPYEEALQAMKEFEIRVQERKAAEERAVQEKLAQETAAREQAEREAAEVIRLEAERKTREREERERRIKESRTTPTVSKKPSRGMDL
ncbi:MAG: MobF family relaxase, partial [Victivallales bacterium]|nr:MobF family relaxase [Victivallales bacterium]